MNLVGIRIISNDSPRSRTFWNIFYWFEFANLVTSFVLDVLHIIEVISEGNYEDAFTVVLMLPCMGYLILALLKSYKMVYPSFRPIYENLIVELRDMWPQGEIPDEESQVLKKALKELSFVVKCYYWCNYCLLFSVVLPNCTNMIRRALGADIPRTLTFYYWLPFDQLQPVVYELLFTYQAWHTLLTICFIVCGDLLFCIFLSHITTQFDLLAIKIQRLIYVPIDKQLIPGYPLGEYCINNSESEMRNEQTCTANELDIKYQKAMAEIVARHHTLIRLSKDVEEIFSFAIFCNFLYSSVIICFCAFCCVLIEKWHEIMYKVFLTTTLSQIWLLCWHGQKLLDSSSGIADALFNSGWYRAPQKLKSSLLIMLHRSQKKVQVTTYGFSVISLVSFTVIIKTAWSYLTLLLNTYQP